MSELKIIKLRRQKGTLERYGFSIGLGGFIVNGFVWFRQSNSIRMPSCQFAGKRHPLVKAYGIHIKRLRTRLERMIQDGNYNEGSGHATGE
jgi:hypothetical protein